MEPAAASGNQAELWRRAEAVIPRGVSSGHRVGWEQVLVRAQGAYLWDANGKRYTDFLLAWGPIILGHCDARVNRAVYDAVSTCDLTGIGPQFGEIEVAEMICQVMPCAEKVAFCTSGTDAAMHAAHVARVATGRRKLLKFHGSYHGWSDLVAVGGARADSTPASPIDTPNSGGLHPDSLADVIVVEWNDVEGLRQAFAEHGHELAACFTEPYMHSFGCVAPANGFLSLMRELCTTYGVALIFDEIKTGFRAALGGYQSICGVTPDLTAFGKAVANGYSIAGLAGSDAFMSCLGAYSGVRATIDGTYNASPYAMAAARQTLEILAEGEVIPRLYDLGERMRAGLTAAIEEARVEACVTGLGSEYAIYFRRQPPRSFREALDVDADAYARYHAALLAGGVVEPAFATGDRRICAATTEEDIDRAVEVAAAALAGLNER